MPGFGTSSFYRQGPYQIRPTGTSYVAAVSPTPPPFSGMGPGTPSRQSNFRTSLNQERATSAMGEASYAAMAPLPKVNGVYKGAYGEGPQAEQQAMAARNSFIQKKRDTANFQNLGPGLGSNYYRKQEVEDQQLGNATTLANAQAGLAQATGDAAVGTADAKMKAAENLDPGQQLKSLMNEHKMALSRIKELETQLARFQNTETRSNAQQQQLKQRQDYDKPLQDAKVNAENARAGFYKGRTIDMGPSGGGASSGTRNLAPANNDE